MISLEAEIMPPRRVGGVFLAIAGKEEEADVSGSCPVIRRDPDLPHWPETGVASGNAVRECFFSTLFSGTGTGTGTGTEKSLHFRNAKIVGSRTFARTSQHSSFNVQVNRKRQWITKSCKSLSECHKHPMECWSNGVLVMRELRTPLETRKLQNAFFWPSSVSSTSELNSTTPTLQHSSAPPSYGMTVNSTANCTWS